MVRNHQSTPLAQLKGKNYQTIPLEELNGKKLSIHLPDPDQLTTFTNKEFEAKKFWRKFALPLIDKNRNTSPRAKWNQMGFPTNFNVNFALVGSFLRG